MKRTILMLLLAACVTPVFGQAKEYRRERATMATTRHWYGRTPGSEGNWATAANFIPSGVPISTDTVIFDNGEQPVTAGLDQTGVLLAALHVRESYRGNIGAPGRPLIIAASLLVVKGSGTEYHIEPAVVTTAIIALPRSESMCYFGGPIGTATYVYITGGRVIIGAGYVMGQFIHVAPDPFGTAPLPHVTFEDGIDLTGGAGPYNVLLDGGTLVVNANLTNVTLDSFIHQAGGVLELNHDVNEVFTTGGLIRHNDGAISNLVIRGGVYDAGVSTVPRTINGLTAANDATVILRTDVGAVTVNSFRKVGRPVIIEEEG